MHASRSYTARADHARHGIALLALCLVLLTGLGGCAPMQPVTREGRESNLLLLQDGTIRLTGDIEQSWNWITHRDDMIKLYYAQDWPNLVNLVASINYENDLGYMYLGESAEKLGHPEAAIRYYQLGYGIAMGSKRYKQCELHNECLGLDLRRELPRRVASIRSQMQAKLEAEQARKREEERRAEEERRNREAAEKAALEKKKKKKAPETAKAAPAAPAPSGEGAFTGGNTAAAPPQAPQSGTPMSDNAPPPPVST
ncbi:hypothetical protein FVW20_19090, partial [Desulfovibrio oxamicus]|nr:hypothetical protein [Nitratidesulfovibrio oxamicus]